MVIRVGINGFGRRGRNVFKALYREYGDAIAVVAANDLGDIDTLVHLLTYDSVYGWFCNEKIAIGRTAAGIDIGGQELRIPAEHNPADLPRGRRWASIS